MATPPAAVNADDGDRAAGLRFRGNGFVVLPRNVRKSIISCYSWSRFARFAEGFGFVVSSFITRGTERKQRGRERILWIQGSGVQVPSSTLFPANDFLLGRAEPVGGQVHAVAGDLCQCDRTSESNVAL